jgi:hypothetical protein
MRSDRIMRSDSVSYEEHNEQDVNEPRTYSRPSRLSAFDRDPSLVSIR